MFIKAKRKSQKLFPFVTIAEKHEGVSIQHCHVILLVLQRGTFFMTCPLPVFEYKAFTKWDYSYRKEFSP